MYIGRLESTKYVLQKVAGQVDVWDCEKQLEFFCISRVIRRKEVWSE